MKILIAILVILTIPPLCAEDKTYHQSDLEKWEGIDTPVIDSCPDAKRIFEYLDQKRDLAMKIFIDQKNLRAFVAFWPTDAEVSFKRDGKPTTAEEVVKPMSVAAFEVNPHYDINGIKTNIENQERRVHLFVGAWFERPKSGSLGKAANRCLTWMFTWRRTDSLFNLDLMR